MMTAVRQTVTVGAGGRLELVAPDLPAGTVADVIVLVPEVPAPPVEPTPAERLAALDLLRSQVTLTEEQARRWIEEIRLERLAWNRPPPDALQP